MPETPGAAMLWTSAEIATATGGEALGAPFSVTGLSIDTRSLKPGELFVALVGERDGHEFQDAAAAAGAAGVLVSHPPLRGGGEAPLPAIRVADTLHALEALAAAARDRSSARRCAVTGSVGKTSVTQAIAAALRLAGPSHAPVKSFNNHIGVPLTLAALPREARYAVFELGMNHAGEIAPLSRLVAPHVALVTTVGPVHVENFPDGEAGVARAKAEVFEGLAEGGVAILNADDKWFDLLADAARSKGARVLSFGRGEDCDARLIGFEPAAPSTASRSRSPKGGGSDTAAVVDAPPLGALAAKPTEGGYISARLHGRPISFPIAQAGAHWGPNSMAVLLAVEALGAPLDCALAALAAFAPLAGRGATQRVALAGGAYTLVDESYNANPISVRAALDTLAKAPPRRIAVLTDMLELGPEAERHHAELAEPIRAADVAATYLAGPSMRHLHEALPPGRRGVWAHSADELAPAVVAAVRAGDTVMVKGSNGSQASRIVAALLAAAAAVPARGSR
jgi:UDP-N-acetylmuramoyl-tripeptide--D-alanyl-D-alanine ligase